MEKKRIVISGASGFIGSELCRYFASRNYEVIGLVRSIPDKTIPNTLFIKHNLGESVPRGVFSPGTIFVHGSYVRSTQKINSSELNISGSEKLVAAARENACSRIVFLSSFSSGSDASSAYGKEKYAVEKFFEGSDGLVLRLGWVAGKGGSFYKVYERIIKGGTLPLIGGGNQPVQLLAVSDLGPMMEKAIAVNLNGLFFVAQTEAVSLRDFAKLIWNKQNRKGRFLSIPYFLAKIAAGMAGNLKIPFPVDKENILGLKDAKPREVDSFLKKVDFSIVSPGEILEKENLFQ